MRTTLNLDDDLLKEAARLSGLSERTAIVREALTALIQSDSARRLARLGGSESQENNPPPSPLCLGVILVDTSVYIDHFRTGDKVAAERSLTHIAAAS